MPERIIEGRPHDLGEGFEVSRVLPHRTQRMVGPFVFLDHMGPVDMPAPIPANRDVRPHPHIGLSTVTWLFDGQMTHRDSLGVEQVITPGSLNWMTSGAGISHSERFDGMRGPGGRIEGVQLWAALPEEHEDDAPSFDHYPAEVLPGFDADGVSGHVIAGSAWGLSSPARTHSPLFYLQADMQAGARLALPEGYTDRALFVAAGEVEVDGRRHGPNRLLVFAADAHPRIGAGPASRVMLLGGEPLGPRYMWWNLVSSRRERIREAAAAWKAGEIALPPLDHDEFIPLPDAPPLP